MGRVGVSKDDVYKAAQAIAEDGSFPTIQSVRAKIGSGSLVTIHKHLLAWKQERLLQPAVQISAGKNAIKAREVFEQKVELENIVQKQIAQNIVLSEQLLILERENLELKSRLTILEAKQHEMTAENTQLHSKVAEHNTLFLELKSAHLEAFNLMLHDKSIEIERLNAELKTVHLASMEMVRQTSFDGQDLLMSERVKNINLHEQIKALNEKISKQELRTITAKDNGAQATDNIKPKVIKSYTLDEIYAQKPLVGKDVDEGVV